MDGGEKYTIQMWLETATKDIRFGPDRKAAERELREHIEDKTADLQRIFPGMTYFEAEERALSQMGDAEEIGRELAKIHKPWLGYLWKLSQYILRVTALVGILCLFSILTGTGNGWYSNVNDNWSIAVSAVEDDQGTRLEPPAEQAVVDGYTCTVREAVLERGEDYCRLNFLLRVSSHMVWARAAESPQYHLSAVDSVGNVYHSMYQWEQGVTITKNRMVLGNIDRYGPFYQDYAMWVSGLDPEAEWVRLEYDWLGRSFQITVDLGREAGA